MIPARNRFRNRLFINYSLVFAVFTLFIVLYQYDREKKYRIARLNSSLEDIVSTTDRYIDINEIFIKGNYLSIDTLVRYMPHVDLRLTVIAPDGEVLYDNFFREWHLMENHKSRPEVVTATENDYGTAIRTSGTTGKVYYYYAREYEKYYVRAALIYDLRVINFLRSGTGFFMAIAGLFLVMWIVLLAVSASFSKTVTLLKDFALEISRNRNSMSAGIIFPNDELGIIGREITEIYSKLLKTRDELSLEREKLFSHLSALNEGVAFFSHQKELILSNNHFTQYLHIISENLGAKPSELFSIKEFEQVESFINRETEKNPMLFELPVMEYKLSSGGRYFSVKCIIFNDKSFEVIVTDITRNEKNRILKQQMTSNIAHELKTPVTSIMGYIDTLAEYEDIEPEKRQSFLRKASAQAKRLADLVNDLVTLNRIEEATGNFRLEPVNMKGLINEVTDNFSASISAREMTVVTDIPRSVAVNGNPSLILSIFQNLLINSVKYAGIGKQISIVHFREEGGYHYFSFSDDGDGVPAEHLGRIFERFYRIDTGRSRKEGGTGLGLAIVKNAVTLHKGEITARLKQGGGMEFIISLPAAKGKIAANNRS